MHTTPRRLLGVLAAGACVLATLATTSSADAAPRRPAKPARSIVPIQLLSFNDFHGALETPTGSSGRNIVENKLDPATNKPVVTSSDAGGVAYLATHLAQARKGHRNSLTVAAGDLIGATPLLSAAFHDEPTIESMNKLGLDVSAVGNHEFDEGYKELQRMDRGGCLADGDGEANQDSCPQGRTFRGAKFDYLAANVKYAGTDETILPSYSIQKVGGAKIGFIGMTLEDTPGIVTASGVAGLEFADEVQTANKLVPVLRRKGVKAIVVLLHQGGNPSLQKVGTDPTTGKPVLTPPTYDYTCGKGGTLDPASPVVPIAQNLHPQIDMVISGHTHQPYVCDVPDRNGRPRLVTSASSNGRLYTETNLLYDRRTRDIVRRSVDGSNEQVSRDVVQDPAQLDLIGTFKRLVEPIASRVVGRINADVLDDQNPAGESALGDLIADAQLADPTVVTGGQEPVIAFMNPGGIRSDLIAANQTHQEAVGDVTYQEAFTVQPFNNFLVSMTLTGQQIYDLLAEQTTSPAGARRYVLQVSEGFSYRLGTTGAVDGSVTLDGTPIDKTASYRVVTNNFLSDGGDSFPTFTKGTGKYVGGLDIDAFANYLTASSPYTPGPLDRIIDAR